MNKKTTLKAFSLIELSLVILVVGILIAGVMQGRSLIIKTRLSSARALTQSSPIAGIPNLLLWFEATAEKSFLDSETQDGSTLSRWFSINPQSNKGLYFQQNSGSAADHPTYVADCINGLPCVNFSGSAASFPGGGMDLSSNLVDGSSKYLSLFIVLTTPKDNFHPNDGADNGLVVFLSSGTSTATSLQFTTNGKLEYYSDQSIGKGLASPTVNSLSQNYIFSIIDDNSSNIYQYRNGTVSSGAGGASNVNKVFGTTYLGYYPSFAWPERFKGNIAELIIYTKALKTEERKAVEKYLSQKWGIGIST